MAIGKIVQTEVCKDGWYGIDLDETLAFYTGPSGNTKIGPIILDIMVIAKRWLHEKKDVRLFTARAGFPDEISKIEAYLLEHDLQDMKITNVKDHGMVILLDDKAREVVGNTGIIIGGLRDTIIWRH
jgi:hypothetical protein